MYPKISLLFGQIFDRIRCNKGGHLLFCSVCDLYSAKTTLTHKQKAALISIYTDGMRFTENLQIHSCYWAGGEATDDFILTVITTRGISPPAPILPLSSIMREISKHDVASNPTPWAGWGWVLAWLLSFTDANFDQIVRWHCNQIGASPIWIWLHHRCWVSFRLPASSVSFCPSSLLPTTFYHCHQQIQANKCK